MSTTIKYMTAIACIVTWVASALLNYIYASTLDGVGGHAYIFGAVSVACDVAKVGWLFALVYCLASKRRFAALCAGFLFVACTGWSLYSASGYASTNIFASVEPGLINQNITKLKLNEIETLQKSITWLQKQKVSSRSERKSMRNELRQARSSLSSKINELKDSKSTTLNSHAHSSMISDMTGASQRSILNATALFFAVLVESICVFGLFVLFSPDRPRGRKPLKKAPKSSAEAPDPKLNVFELKDVLEKSVPSTAKELARKFCINHEWTDQDEPVTASKAYGLYAGVCNVCEIAPLTQQAFGKVSTQFVLKRKEKGLITYYPMTYPQAGSLTAVAA